MKDHRDDQLDKLFAMVRPIKPAPASVEEHFETRLLARIAERRGGQAIWSAWAWRLIPLFSAIVIVLGLGSALIDPARTGDLFATFTNGYEEYLATSLLAGG